MHFKTAAFLSLLSLAATALGQDPPAGPSPFSSRDCHAIVTEHHSYGGGGPGQENIDETTGGYNVWNADGKLIISNHDNRDNFQGMTTVIPKESLNRDSDVTFFTSYNRASSNFMSCWYDHGWGKTNLEVQNSIDSGIVSVMTTRCDLWFECGV